VAWMEHEIHDWQRSRPRTTNFGDEEEEEE
jgi:hypothetical protein